MQIMPPPGWELSLAGGGFLFFKFVRYCLHCIFSRKGRKTRYSAYLSTRKTALQKHNKWLYNAVLLLVGLQGFEPGTDRL